MNKKTVIDIDIANKRVLVRPDLMFHCGRPAAKAHATLLSQGYRRLFTATVAAARPANLNPQLLHARAQRTGVEPQDLGGPIGPFDPPARSFAHGGDVLSLHLFQSLTRLVRRRGRQRLRDLRDL